MQSNESNLSKINFQFSVFSGREIEKEGFINPLVDSFGRKITGVETAKDSTICMGQFSSICDVIIENEQSVISLANWDLLRRPKY